MIECMSLDAMMHFAGLLGDIVTVFGDFQVVRIEAETETTWWYLTPTGEPADGNAAAAMLCRGPEPLDT